MLLKVRGYSFNVYYIENNENVLDFISRLFHLVCDETVDLSQKNIVITAQFLGPKAFKLNIILVQPLKMFFFKNFWNL